MRYFAARVEHAEAEREAVGVLLGEPFSTSPLQHRVEFPSEDRGLHLSSREGGIR
jgi:hypothetical protein